MRSSQQGLSLIELMLSLALGLIIVAAAMMLFISGQKSFALQQGAADLQDNSNFALSYMAKDIRMANLNNSTANLTSDLAHAGVVLKTSNISGATASTPVSSVEVASSSNVNLGSDQLVIQYLPQQTGGFDCEGNEIVDTAHYVVQRYFVRRDANPNTNESSATALVLACDAGRASAAGVTDFGGDGQILMKRVDYFHVLLVVEDGNGNFRDMKISDYLTSAPTARILGVKIGILARSNQSVGLESTIKVTDPFSVLDQSVTLKTSIQNQQTKNLRQVIVQTIAIRNALGAK